MNSGQLGLTTWSSGLAGLGYAVFVLHLLQLGYLRQPREWSKLTILAAVALTALWGALELALALTNLTLLSPLSVLADQLRYAGWFGFLLTLLQLNHFQKGGGSSKWLIFWAIVLASSGPLALLLSALGIPFFWQPARLVLMAAMAMPVFALVLLEQVFRNATEDSRWNIKPLCLGLSGTYLFDLYLFSQAVLFNHPDDDALSIRGAVHALMVPLLLLSSTRRSDWIAMIRLSPKAAFHSATLLMAGLYLLFISGVGYYVRYFGGEWGRALQLGLVVLALILMMILAMSGTMRAKVRVFLGKHFFRYRYDYREEWLKFTHALSAKNSPEQMGQQVVRGLAEMLESPAGGLWLRVKGETAFSQTARWNLAQISEKEEASSAMCCYMTEGGKVINLEEYRSFSRRYGSLKIPPWLQELPQAWLLVPLMMGDDLIGFVVLARARILFDVNWEVLDLLKTAGQQAASYLAQMQATEALLEVRKFDAFNKMSAFVVHDLKNIVTQLSLMLKNAKRLGANPEFQQDMLMTVENSLDRMRQLMLQLREGATPPGAAFGVNLGAMVRRVQAVCAARGRQLEVDLAANVDTRGHEERLERIIGHVVQNAFDATATTGSVSLKLERAGGQAKIVVTDTGHGMTEDFIRDRLFKPFQTTKQAGMGIGAYESYQYVQELGGKIEVQSKVNHGTTVTLLLPLFETQTKSDLHSMETV
jgi:putative PEP-CTERM system histidine kinase